MIWNGFPGLGHIYSTTVLYDISLNWLAIKAASILFYNIDMQVKCTCAPIDTTEFD